MCVLCVTGVLACIARVCAAVLIVYRKAWAQFTFLHIYHHIVRAIPKGCSH